MTNETNIIWNKDQISELTEIICQAWDKTSNGQHKLSNTILELSGMSGRKYRAFINNIIENIPDARYLEIGSWAGSTACSAMWKNSCTITCIDNWSEFGGPRDIFNSNIQTVLTPCIDFKFIESDFRQVDFNNIGKYNLYLYDGPHTGQDQYDGIRLALPALDNEFILIIDDWNWYQVQHGTKKALTELGLNIMLSLEITTTTDGSHGYPECEHSDWHNGYFLAVVSQ